MAEICIYCKKFKQKDSYCLEICESNLDSRLNGSE